MATPLATADAVDTTTASATLDTGALTGAPITTRPGRWIDGWDPEDVAVSGSPSARPIARRNLVLSIFAEFLGFASGRCGASSSPGSPTPASSLTVDQMFWLVAVPSLVGASLRIPYTFAVPMFGGRNWTDRLGLLLLIPTVGLFWVGPAPGVLVHDVCCSSRPSPASAAATSPPRWPTSPSSTREREKGRALGPERGGRQHRHRRRAVRGPAGGRHRGRAAAGARRRCCSCR